jgi:thiosulfate reductase cytochrome b subunit
MTVPTRTAAGFRASRWFKLVWIIPVVIVAMVLIVLAAKLFRASDAGISFLHDYPGHSGLPDFAPVGFPAWLAWQHGLNAFFILYIIRFGWQVRTTKRPAAYWTRNNSGVIKTKGSPVRISIDLWAHISLDTLWVINGILFYVLIFSTGQWVRIIPTRWDIFPNAISAGIQYASLNWPTENGWANYNALQTISYFLVVFIAAPIAVITGIRMAPGFAAKFKRFDKLFPLPVARAIHFPTMIFFVVFIIIHVVLVLATGALNNLNHMYAGNNGNGWVGFIIFAASVVVMIGAWFALSPFVLRTIAGTMGKVGR